mmetsp:Transcript_15470/g.44760  ORF Transcript_15470/g.44760 Transcript_15470/m.44760 type:complete len:479 (-) Transcript_15470:644-2080(-)|eukprot:CAMPEP_0181058460 /NCGR_PEP_ID=MMETSP1070-20121207/20832_1 /TAXON_ID=265543 /ORGANISM="Minutocellus polymorphus, Strain NH13" /LENGTH=478 /DNA_ID=CAMNT_0023138015 /DNA_START=251 /DNA_END=1687 /DNA_ORIENTATION=+
MAECSPSYSPSGRSRVLPGVSTVDVLSLATSALAAAVAASLPIRQLAEQPDDGTKDADTSSNVASNGGPKDQLQKNGSKQNVRTKLDGTVVTDADGAAQRIIVAALRHVSPDVRIVGEESRTEMERSNSKTFEEAARRFLEMDINSDAAATGGTGRSDDDASEDNTNEEDDKSQPDAEHEIAGIFQMVREEINTRYREAIGRRIDMPDILCAGIDSTGNSCDYRSNEFKGGSSVLSPIDHVVDSSRVSVLIDPLDGTSCYASGKHEYVTTLVAIVLDNTPIFGVICKPFGHEGGPCILNSGCFAVYGGVLLNGVYVAGGDEIERSRLRQQQSMSAPTNAELVEVSKSKKRRRAIISKSRAGGVVGKCIQALADEELLQGVPAFISGAGVKALHLLVGSSDESLWFFPKAGTSLWDVAAADALLRVVGGRLSDKYGEDIDYDRSRQDAENADGVVACNDAELHARCIQIFNSADWKDDE